MRPVAALGDTMIFAPDRSSVLAGMLVWGATGCGPVPPAPLPPCAASASALRFERHVLLSEFVAEAIGVLDVNGDGRPDLVAPPYWWSGPDFARHELAAPRTEPLDPLTEYASVYGVYPWDVDEDGCLDVVVPSREIDPQMFWWENPRAADGSCGDPTVHWTAHPVVPDGFDMTLEGPIVATLGDGQPALLAGRRVDRDDTAVLGWWRPGADPSATWEFHPVSEVDFRGAYEWFHGIGAGDVNGDLVTDILTTDGWFEGPDDPNVSPWPLHAFPAIADDAPDPMLACSRLRLRDLDADGHPDLICGRPHNFGLYWWRQVVVGGEVAFERHVIDEVTVSAMHAVRTDDLDDDGVCEIVTGERYAATFGIDPTAPPDPPLVYYSVCGEGSELRFTPHVIDEDSGVGIQFEVADLDGDARADIAIASKRGVFYFLQR